MELIECNKHLLQFDIPVFLFFFLETFGIKHTPCVFTYWLLFLVLWLLIFFTVVADAHGVQLSLFDVS